MKRRRLVKTYTVMIEDEAGTPLSQSMITVRDADRAREIASRLLAEDRTAAAAAIFERGQPMGRLTKAEMGFG